MALEERMPINAETLRLRTLDAQRALEYLAISARNMIAFSGDTVREPEERELAISPRTTAAGFWNHFIVGSIALVGAEFDRAEATGSPADPELVRTVQKRIVKLVSRWMEHPIMVRVQISWEEMKLQEHFKRPLFLSTGANILIYFEN